MNVALVLAGGTGSRLGADIPKQYLMCGGRMVIDYCLEALDESAYIDSIWVVADVVWQDHIKKVGKLAGYALPGKNRQLSVYNGLMSISRAYGEEDVNVLIHDAARPFLTGELIQKCKEALSGHDGVLPVLPMKDTVYYSGKCKCCQDKRYEMCSNYNYLGSRCNGGLAEYVAVPEWNLLELTENISYRQAAMLEPMAVAVHAMRQFTIKEGTNVCVIGAGTIGMLLVMLLKASGIHDVYVYGNKESQERYAAKIGIDKEHYSPQDINADYVFECVGKNETINQAIELCAPAGHIVLVGNPYSDMDIPKDIYWKILRKQLKLSGTWNSSYTGNMDDDWNYVISLLKTGTIHPECFITHEFNLSDIQEGTRIMRDKSQDYVKIMCIND